MTTDEKKHFILQYLASDNFRGGSADTSQLALSINPPLTVNEVNVLCREMEYDVPLKIFSHKDSGETLGVLQTQEAIDAFKTCKYLHINSIDNIEFEILNFLYNKSTSTRTRINHILVSSSLTVFETTEILKNMIEAKLIQMQPNPIDLRYSNGNKLIDNHVLAFENIHRPINANITHEGKTYFKQNYMDEPKTVNHFHMPDNSGQVQINQPQSSSDLEFNPKYTKHKPDAINKTATIIGIILTIIGLIIGYLQLIKG